MNIQILSEYLEFLEVEKGLSENTLEAYRRDITELFDFCTKELSEISRQDINSYILKLREENYTSTSVTRKIASFRGFFKWACAIEILLKENLTPKERVIFELLYDCGLRVSELVNMKINDIDMSGKFLTCTGKGSKERIVPFGNCAIDAIKNYLPQRD